jgi:2-hydroxychromene-2-carboxylate isomerase|tara:strand:- start:102 stop:686 length:585 start_codon:yes stop_codon:yes gene_type:complete
MTKFVEFYYDFVSPYSFLAHKRIRKIEKRESINFIYKPILLGALHNLGGITAPAFIDSKKKFIIQDCEMVAKKFNINFKFNDKFPINTLNLMRGILIINKELKNKYIDLFFDAYWLLNIDLSDEKNFRNILEKIQININNFFSDIKKQETKDLLKNLTKEAFDKEIFGAPTFIVNNKLFWGQDRLDYAIDELLN